MLTLQVFAKPKLRLQEGGIRLTVGEGVHSRCHLTLSVLRWVQRLLRAPIGRRDIYRDGLCMAMAGM
jgi:hypothetical protein